MMYARDMGILPMRTMHARARRQNRPAFRARDIHTMLTCAIGLVMA
jgi:hypothetical protein